MRVPKQTLMRLGIVIIGAVVFWIAAWKLATYINQYPYSFAPERTAVEKKAAQSEALDSYKDIGNLLITLATGILAGIGWFLVNRPKRRCATFEFLMALAVMFFACLSIYCGYLGSQNLTFCIDQSLPVGVAVLQMPRRFQLVGLLLSVFFFAIFLGWDLTEAELG
jgi:hypothetical protein